MASSREQILRWVQKALRCRTSWGRRNDGTIGRHAGFHQDEHQTTSGPRAPHHSSIRDGLRSGDKSGSASAKRQTRSTRTNRGNKVNKV